MNCTCFLTVWYQTCASTLQKYQEEQQDKDEAERQKQRSVYLDQLKEEMEKLNSLDTGASNWDFLKSVGFTVLYLLSIYPNQGRVLKV